MKIKNEVLERLLRTNALAKLMSCEEFDIELTFNLSGLGETVVEGSKPFSKARGALIKKYADDQGIILRKNELKFNEEMDKLLDLETEIPHLDKKFSMRKEDIPSKLLSANDIIALKGIINFE